MLLRAKAARMAGCSRWAPRGSSVVSQPRSGRDGMRVWQTASVESVRCLRRVFPPVQPMGFLLCVVSCTWLKFWVLASGSFRHSSRSNGVFTCFVPSGTGPEMSGTWRPSSADVKRLRRKECHAHVGKLGAQNPCIRRSRHVFTLEQLSLKSLKLRETAALTRLSGTTERSQGAEPAHRAVRCHGPSGSSPDKQPQHTGHGTPVQRKPVKHGALPLIPRHVPAVFLTFHQVSPHVPPRSTPD